MNTDKKQALSVHLKAIRRMLIVSVASVAVLFVLFFYLLCGPLVDFVLAPVRARGIEVITTSVSEALMMQFKVCLIAAVIAGMPVIIWQVWVFVAPALYPQEKRLFAALFFVALLLFAACLLLPLRSGPAGPQLHCCRRRSKNRRLRMLPSKASSLQPEYLPVCACALT